MSAVLMFAAGNDESAGESEHTVGMLIDDFGDFLREPDGFARHN